MTNGEKHKTAQERAEAFEKFCGEHDCTECARIMPAGFSFRTDCRFAWLELEANEESAQ